MLLILLAEQLAEFGDRVVEEGHRPRVVRQRLDDAGRQVLQGRVAFAKIPEEEHDHCDRAAQFGEYLDEVDFHGGTNSVTWYYVRYCVTGGGMDGEIHFSKVLARNPDEAVFAVRAQLLSVYPEPTFDVMILGLSQVNPNEVSGD